MVLVEMCLGEICFTQVVSRWRVYNFAFRLVWRPEIFFVCFLVWTGSNLTFSYCKKFSENAYTLFRALIWQHDMSISVILSNVYFLYIWVDLLSLSIISVNQRHWYKKKKRRCAIFEWEQQYLKLLCFAYTLICWFLHLHFDEFDDIYML